MCFFSSARCMGQGSATLAGFVLALRALVVGQATKRSRIAKALYLSVLGSLGCGNKKSTYWKSSHQCVTHSGTERHATAFALLCVMLYRNVSNDPYHTKSIWQWHACSHVFGALLHVLVIFFSRSQHTFCMHVVCCFRVCSEKWLFFWGRFLVINFCKRG